MQEQDSAEVVTAAASTTKKSRRKRRFSKKWLGIGAIVLVLVGLLTAGILLQRIAIALMPNTKAQVVAEVCTSEDITRFNEDIQKDYSAFKTRMEEIAKRPGYQNDTSCVFMQYRYFYEEMNYTKVQEMATRFKELVSAGHYSSNAINYDQSIPTLDAVLESVRTLSDGKTVEDGE